MSDILNLRTHNYRDEAKLEPVDATLEANEIAVHMDANPLNGFVLISVLERSESGVWFERITLEVHSQKPVSVEAAPV